MRPVETWKYTAAPPTPTRDGPAALDALQVRAVAGDAADLVELPAGGDVAAVLVESLAPEDAANAAYAPPIVVERDEQHADALGLRRRTRAGAIRAARTARGRVGGLGTGHRDGRLEAEFAVDVVARGPRSRSPFGRSDGGHLMR